MEQLLLQQQLHHIVRLSRYFRELEQYTLLVLSEGDNRAIHKLSGFLYFRLQWDVKRSILTIEHMDKQTNPSSTYQRYHFDLFVSPYRPYIENWITLSIISVISRKVRDV